MGWIQLLPMIKNKSDKSELMLFGIPASPGIAHGPFSVSCTTK